MTLLGLDFDNTLVCYDDLFHQLALEKDLIPDNISADKIVIRDYLRGQGRDEDFTLLQGEVYGLRILDAKPAEGMLDALKDLQLIGIEMALVSHKTHFPYKGPRYDLHRAAMSWLEHNSFFSEQGLNWSTNQVYFEATKVDKVRRINLLNCTHYVDDLPEIIHMLPEFIKKILYDPGKKYSLNSCLTIADWSEISTYII